jgi:hypothetical protein
VRGFVAIAVGAVLLIAAAAGFIIVPEHAPGFGYGVPGRPAVICSGPATPEEAHTALAGCRTLHPGLSRTAYDALRIATWAALILGVLVAAMGLIQTARVRPERTADRC